MLVKLPNASSDGENMINGCDAGLVTLIARCAKFNKLRVRFTPHQIDIIVKSAAEASAAAPVSRWSTRSQNDFVNWICVKCSKKTSRWMHSVRVLNFYKKYHRSIIVHTEDQHPENLPSAEW
uniref:LAGLIDADG endonuclease n=1 Tax=Peronospora matthiolae TaxID=2874970 RepID=A0AAV1T3J2_9STRA